jgi:photosystem II stability/assembly factor-like uncharacterized protein
MSRRFLTGPAAGAAAAAAIVLFGLSAELSAGTGRPSLPVEGPPDVSPPRHPSGAPYTTDAFGFRLPSGERPEPALASPPGPSEPAGAALDWEFAGPFGGTVQALAVSPLDPELVLAGMDVDFTSGLYRSVDGGRTWSVDALDAVGVNDIEFAPDGTAYVAAAYGAYRRAPGETAWTRLPVVGYSYFHEVCVHPTHPDEIWLGMDQHVGPGSHVGVLRSRDGGQTWEDVTPPSPLTATACTGIAFDPNDPAIVVVCFGYHHKGGQLWRSTDGGTTWLTPDNVFANPLTEVVHDGSRFLLSGGDVYVNQSVGLYASTDGGVSWNPLHGSNWPSRVVRDIELDPSAPGTIFAATSRGVFQTTDAGVTWSFGVGNSGSLSVNAVRCDLRDPGAVFAGAARKGVWRKGAGDPTFRESSTGLRALYLEDVAVNPQRPLQMSVSVQERNTGGIFSTSDGGRSWSEEPVPSVRFGSLAFAADGTLYAASEGPAEPGAPEGLYRREADGRWTSLGPNPGPYYEADVLCVRASRTNPGLLILGGVDWRTAKPTIWRSTDRGSAWTRVFSGSSRPGEVSWVTAIEIFEDGTDSKMLASHTAVGGVLTSTSGGATWANLSSGVPDMHRGWDLTRSPVDPATWFLATSGECYRSTDAGATWTWRGSSQSLRHLLCDPWDVDVVYGAGSWVVRSVDGGATFAPFDAGLDPGALGAGFAVGGGSQPALLLATPRGLYFRTLSDAVPGAARAAAPGAGLSAAERGGVPAGLAVTGPNPFHEATEVRFTLRDPQSVSLDVYDVRGARVRNLVSGRMTAGDHRSSWDGRDEAGRPVVAGVYFIRLVAGGSRQDVRVARVR